jgi:hypothetical protein
VSVVGEKANRAIFFGGRKPSNVLCSRTSLFTVLQGHCHGDRMPLALDVEGLHCTLSPTTSKWLNGQWRWFPGAAQSW